MLNAQSFVAAFALAIYLSAAFLPCETPVASMPKATPSAHAGVDASVPAHGASGPRSRREVAGHHAGHAREGNVGGDARGGDHHAGHHAAHVEPVESGPSKDRRSRRTIQHAKLELKPTCLCGCRETRSSIGGGTARLGSVVPGTVVARLIEVEPIRVAEQAPAEAIELRLDIDPVPI